MSPIHFILILLTLVSVACTPHTKRDINKFESRGDIKKLTGLANKGGKTERATAIRALGNLKDPRAIKALSEAMSSTSWVEREAAVISLGMIKDHLSLQPLIMALQDKNRFVREHAATELMSVTKALGKNKNTRIVKILINGIRENNTYVRTQTEKAFHIAIDELRIIKQPKFFQLLVELLKDDNRYLRRQAAWALGKLNDERAILPLIDAQNDRDHLLRDIASQSLKRINNPRSISEFVKALRTGDEISHDRTIAALSAVKGRREILQLEGLLQDKSSEVKIGIIKALGNIGKKTSINKIVKLLNDTDMSVRQTASDTLTKAGWSPENEKEMIQFCIAAQNWFDCRALGDGVVPELVLRLEDNDAAVRKISASVLFSLNWQPASEQESVLHCIAKRDWDKCVDYGEKALDPLIRELNDPDPEVIKAVIKSLVAIKHNRGMQPLIHVLETSDVEMRIIVVKALATFNHPLVQKVLIKTLEDKHKHVRQAAAEALNSNIKLFKEKDYFDFKTPLQATATDNNQHVRVIATTLLGELQDSGTIVDILVALEDNHLEVREAASKALRKFNDTSAIEPLVKGLSNQNPEVRIQIIEALTRFKDHRALEPLPPLLKDKDPGVVQQTIKALGKISDPRTIAPLLEMLDASNPDFVVHAIRSLEMKKDPAILTGLYKSSHHKKAEIRNSAGLALLAHGWVPKTESEQGKYCVITKDWLLCEKTGGPAVDALLLELEDTESQSRIESARTLGHIRDLRAIKPLMKGLEKHIWTDDSYLAGQLIESSQTGLINFGKLALPELVGELKNWHINNHLVKILDATGWLPRTDAQLVHFQIARRSQKELLANWVLTQRVLLEDIKTGEPGEVSNALFTLIGLGQEESVKTLVNTLKDKGSVELAETYLNSNNETLRAAALDWTSDHDLEIKQFSAGNSPIKWGEM